jgi:hypothetical protein
MHVRRIDEAGMASVGDVDGGRAFDEAVALAGPLVDDEIGLEVDVR